jgi:hypothetical protein
MGIDIYARWKGQTEAERTAQYSGFFATQGHIGYLREAYHGEPYATKYLCAEAFEFGRAAIPASVLRERLSHTLALADERERVLYFSTAQEIEAIKQTYRDFVELCERKENETGEAVLIIADY